MAENQIEIEVVLEGTQKVTKELKGLGSAGKSVADAMRTTNEHLGESFTSLTDGVDTVAESIGGLRSGFAAVGTSGAAGITALIGPVALLTTGVIALYQAYQQFSGAQKEAERFSQAMAAAASDLESKLEALSEKGVTPTTEALREFARANIEAQIQKELLQATLEDSSEVFKELIASEKAETKAIIERNTAHKNANVSGAEYLSIAGDTARAITRSKEAQSAFNQIFVKAIDIQQEVSERLKKAGEGYKTLEETSVESLQTKAKEAIARLKNIRLLALETKENQKYVDSLKNEIEEESKLLTIKAKKEDKTALEALNKEVQKNIKLTIEQAGAFDEASLVQLAGIEQRFRLEKAADDKEREQAKKKSEQRRQAAERRRQMEEQQARQAITDQARTQALEIQLAFDGFKEREELARLAYETEINLARDNADKKYQAELRLQLQLKEIDKSRVQQAQKDAAEVEKNRLAIEAKAAKERDARLKREEAERQKAIDQAKKDYEDLLSSVEHYSSGLANAAAGAILFGDSVSEGVAQALNALASEAAVSALIETAKGIASTFTNPAEAGTHFAAAGQFALAAGAARGASALLGGGGGGGVTTGAASSPSGAPQTATAPARAEAMESQVVYNINFGGAVIYDSKRAAEQALADRITTIQNQRRRGAPIPRRA
jgi:hypothetical protein